MPFFKGQISAFGWLAEGEEKIFQCEARFAQSRNFWGLVYKSVHESVVVKTAVFVAYLDDKVGLTFRQRDLRELREDLAIRIQVTFDVLMPNGREKSELRGVVGKSFREGKNALDAKVIVVG